MNTELLIEKLNTLIEEIGDNGGKVTPERQYLARRISNMRGFTVYKDGQVILQDTGEEVSPEELVLVVNTALETIAALSFSNI